MKRLLATFTVSLILGASLGGASAGCVFGDDCDCGEFAPLPAPQDPLPVQNASAHDAEFMEAEMPVDLSAGTVEVTGAQVIVKYVEGGAEYVVTYDVIGAG